MKVLASLAVLGFVCGFCTFAGFVAAVILALASQSGAGWRSRHQAVTVELAEL